MPAEITNSGSSVPNASSPSGRANDRDANPNRSLDGPALLRGRLRIGPGSPWPGQAERLGPRHWSALPGRRVSLSSCAFRPPSRTGGPNGANDCRNLNGRGGSCTPARAGGSGCAVPGNGVRFRGEPFRPASLQQSIWATIAGAAAAEGIGLSNAIPPRPCRRRPWLGCVAAEGRSRRSARSSPTR
jgi:hypothetical protein